MIKYSFAVHDELRFLNIDIDDTFSNKRKKPIRNERLMRSGLESNVKDIDLELRSNLMDIKLRVQIL